MLWYLQQMGTLTTINATHQTSLSSNVLQWWFKCLAKSEVFHLYKNNTVKGEKKGPHYISLEEKWLENSFDNKSELE